MKHKSVKVQEAKKRQAAHEALTPQQRLAKLDAGRVLAKKERAKLAKLIAKEAK